MRVGLVTEAKGPVGRSPAYPAIAEAEQILIACCQPEVLRVSESVENSTTRWRRLIGRGVRRTVGRSSLLPAVHRSDGSPPFDIVIAVLTNIWELPLLEAMPAVRRAHQVVVWIPEVWPDEFLDKRLAFEPYNVADQLVVGLRAAQPHLEAVTDRPVGFMPWAADVERFRPRSLDAARPIDVLNLGRRIPSLHTELVSWARNVDRFYHYDTLASPVVSDALAHREHLASLHRHSSLSFCSYPKLDQPEHDGYRALPSRIWEGLASGNVMIGRPPDPDLQREVVGAEVVRPLSTDAGEAVDQIASLLGSDVTEERSQNLRLAHNQHDWAHRWIELFRSAGHEPPAGLTDRARRLRDDGESLCLEGDLSAR